jgi:hypothetical protein
MIKIYKTIIVRDLYESEVGVLSCGEKNRLEE